jgi:hypothetical protein
VPTLLLRLPVHVPTVVGFLVEKRVSGFTASQILSLSSVMFDILDFPHFPPFGFGECLGNTFYQATHLSDVMNVSSN